jgi:hypothetical protein
MISLRGVPGQHVISTQNHLGGLAFSRDNILLEARWATGAGLYFVHTHDNRLLMQSVTPHSRHTETNSSGGNPQYRQWER